MGRLNLNEAKNLTLDELIPSYATDKAELDSLKKECDYKNALIKDGLLKLGEDVYTAGGYTAKRIVAQRESMNEEKLLGVLRKHGIEGVIKTKEYVDMDALESYLYNNEASTEFATDLATCKTTTEVVQLRVAKEKKKKEEE